MDWFKKLFANPPDYSASFRDSVRCERHVETGFCGGELLIVKFSGHYPDGSAGNSVAESMQYFSEAGYWKHRPAAILFDMSSLEYDWGDYIEVAWSMTDELEVPHALVVGPKCEEALRTLFFGLDSKKTITESPGVFRSLEAARAYLSTEVKKLSGSNGP